MEAVINDVAERIGGPRFQVVPNAGDQSVFESVISKRLALGSNVIVDGDFGCDPGAVGELVSEAVEEDFDTQFSRAKVRSFDGAMLRSYSAGVPRQRAVVLVSACGMPAKSCERWMRFLGKNHFVITWENRLLFEDLYGGPRVGV